MCTTQPACQLTHSLQTRSLSRRVELKEPNQGRRRGRSQPVRTSRSSSLRPLSIYLSLSLSLSFSPSSLLSLSITHTDTHTHTRSLSRCASQLVRASLSSPRRPLSVSLCHCLCRCLRFFLSLSLSLSLSLFIALFLFLALSVSLSRCGSQPVRV